MRSLAETRKRWDTLFSEKSIGVDIRQAVKHPEDFQPCEDGLRSICWKAFLLFGPISLASWPKKLSDSRAAYTSLRDHFLKYIDHPDDLESNADPLADDETSPWSCLRQDEAHREEIYQDVQRCMQDNYYFREPSTQKKMLDVLFIYSKLNPDTGYRQGMHELLAPILWVIECDAIENVPLPLGGSSPDESSQLMTIALDHECIEHDAFNLFCAVMQTAKSFYETGENKDSSPIISRCHRIQQDLLAMVDPELAHHLQEIGVLPQVYLIRWVRLLFGREFDFVDVLRIWDVLFAENVNLHLVDMICIVMLLHVRWSLIDADYSTALTLLLRYSLPSSAGKPEGLVKDARFLTSDRSAQAGAVLIKQFSGKLPKSHTRVPQSSPVRTSGVANPPTRARMAGPIRESASPARSPARYLPQQKNLEALFQEVSGGIQRRTEGWNLSKAVIGAVGEVKRNVNYLQSASISPRPSITSGNLEEPVKANADADVDRLSKRLLELENRNKALAKMLDGALQSLRTCKLESPSDGAKDEDVYNISLAKIQFVSVYMADPEIPIPGNDLQLDSSSINEQVETMPRIKVHEALPGKSSELSEDRESIVDVRDLTVSQAAQPLEPPQKPESPGKEQPRAKKALRPSLAESSFSFMLGENRHRSSFVSSVTDLPERQRDSEVQIRPEQLWNDTKNKQDRKGIRKGDRKADKKGDRKGEESGDDGFTMNSLHGGQKT